MKSIVIYRSKSGNTQAIAELMAKRVETKVPVNPTNDFIETKMKEV